MLPKAKLRREESLMRCFASNCATALHWYLLEQSSIKFRYSAHDLYTYGLDCIKIASYTFHAPNHTGKDVIGRFFLAWVSGEAADNAGSLSSFEGASLVRSIKLPSNAILWRSSGMWICSAKYGSELSFWPCVSRGPSRFPWSNSLIRDSNSLNSSLLGCTDPWESILSLRDGCCWESDRSVREGISSANGVGKFWHWGL